MHQKCTTAIAIQFASFLLNSINSQSLDFRNNKYNLITSLYIQSPYVIDTVYTRFTHSERPGPFCIQSYNSFHLTKLTTFQPRLHLLSLAPQKNIGTHNDSTKNVIAAISLNATSSPDPAIHEFVVAERPKPMIAKQILATFGQRGSWEGAQKRGDEHLKAN